MKGYEQTCPEVESIGQINFHGDGVFTPNNWYQNIRRDNGKAYIEAVVLLGDIVSWYLPIYERDEVTGKTLSIKKKFKSDKLQRTYDSFAEHYAMTKDQARNALKKLADMDLIDLDFRTVDTGSQRLGNVLFVGVNPIRIKEITFTLSAQELTGAMPTETDSYQQENRQLSSQEHIAMPSETQTNTDQSTDQSTDQTTENIENIEKGDFSFFQNSPILKNQENAALPENSISEPKQEIEESCAAPPEIYAIAITEKKIKKARPKKPNEDLESKREAFAPFVVVFNQTAPDRWGKSEDLVEVLDKLAIGRLNTFTKKYGDRSLEIFQKGLLYTYTSKFHCETVVWTLGQYLSNEKPNEFAEKYDRIQAKNQTPFAEESPDRPMSEFDKKAMANYVRFKTAYEKRQQENAA